MSYNYTNTPGGSSFTVPASATPVTVYFLLEGPGGNGGGSIFSDAGGSGGVFYGSVNLPGGTTIYTYTTNAGQGNQGLSFIQLTQLNSGQTSPIAPGTPYVWGGDNGDGGGPGAGGSYAWVGDNTPVALQLTDGLGNVYPVTYIESINGYVGGNDNGAPAAWIPASPLPNNMPWGGQGGNDTGYGYNGLIVLGFNAQIPWTTQPPLSVPCFPLGTRILTPAGYKAVETLEQGSIVTTAANKNVPVKIYNRTIEAATSNTAPYLIPKHSFGFSPVADLRLSPLHAFQIRKGVWQIPKYAALQNKEVKQYGVGESVTYYHVECPNFFTDNLVVDGNVVESFGGSQVKGLKTLYKYNGSLKGFTRASQPSKSLTM